MFAAVQEKSFLVLLALLVGCTTTETFDAVQFPASTVHSVQMSLDNGSATLSGNAGEEATVEARVYGYAGKEEVADRNHDGVVWRAAVESGVLTIESESQYERAGVDLDVTVPASAPVFIASTRDLTLQALRGRIEASGDDVTLENCAGEIEIAAWGWIHAENVGGQVTLLADGSISADLSPLPGDQIRIASGSNGVTVTLPWGVPVDLEVWGDPEEEVFVDDFAFGRVATAPGFFSGVAGPGTVHLEVDATDGPVSILGRW